MKLIKVQLILLVLLISTTGFKIDKPKILIIGDSISMGYTPFVKKQLLDIADIFHNPGNAKHTGYGLENIVSWLEEVEWDIIQFSRGLWGGCYRHPESQVQGNRDKVNGDITFKREDYKNQLDALVKLMRKHSDAELIFLTTTYVPKYEAGRFAKDAKKYNKIARRVMKANGVKINDIYKVSKGIHLEYGKGVDDVHYTTTGYKVLGKHISEYLKQEII